MLTRATGNITAEFESESAMVAAGSPTGRMLQLVTGQVFYVETFNSGFGILLSSGNYANPVTTGDGQVISVLVETNSLVIGEDGKGKLYSISDFTGSVTVTVEAVPLSSVGNITFVFADTASPILFVAGAGVTFKTPFALEMDSQFSTVSMLWQTETDVILFGDWKAV